MNCPSAFALDDLELHERRPPAELAAHVQQCPRCRARRAEHEAARADFRDNMAADVWAGAQRRRARVGRRRLVTAGTALAGAAAAVVLVRIRPAREQRWQAAKGGVAVEVFCRRGGRTFVLAPGEAVREGDELRFRLRGAPEGRYVALGSVDGRGRFSPFYPGELTADSVPRPDADAALPGGITLDDAPGPERLFIVLSSRPIPAREVSATAETLAGTRAAVRAIAGVDVVSTWVVLPKHERGR